MRDLRPASLSREYKLMDRDSLMIETVRLLNESNQTLTSISNHSGVSRSCLVNWKKHKTRRPQAITLRFVLRSLGYELGIHRVR